MREVRVVVRAAVVSGVLSGIPSTLHSIVTEADGLAPTTAAGTLLLPRETSRLRLVCAAALAHAALSLGWTAVLAAVLPRRRTVLAGAAAGLAIAALDLGVVGRRVPAIAALPVLPQVADHVAFGAIVGAVLAAHQS